MWLHKAFISLAQSHAFCCQICCQNEVTASQTSYFTVFLWVIVRVRIPDASFLELLKRRVYRCFSFLFLAEAGKRKTPVL